MTTTAITPWAEKLKKLGNTAAANEVITGKFFSTKAGQLSYDGNKQPNNEFVGIIVAHCNENHYYSQPFNASTPVAPDCYAFGKTEAIDTAVIAPMAPHPKATNKQHAACSGCPMAEWGSDINGGRGKACKEIRRLALIPADAVQNGVEGIAAAPVAYLRVPIMSVKNWSSYVQFLAAKNTAPMAVFTKVSVKPDTKAQHVITFELLGPVGDEELLGALWAKAEQTHAGIDFPYMGEEAKEAPAATKPMKRSGKM